MNSNTPNTELDIRSIVTHALMGHPDVEPQAVDLIVDQCAKLVAGAGLSIPFTTMSHGHLNLLNDHLKLLNQIKEVRDTQAAYFASGQGRYRDKKLLARSKGLERELDRLVAEQLATAETYLTTDTPPSNVNP
ncbi:hypothetical protein [Fibrella forsythiae]|uniref:Uncharacterized protein n=1 Tax=Fibrella forsythiae TaxID=2817061 RepID=A0ABS3JM56_9BACT|nr:hypothetical protein [Fibrella forsythiae]MBO0951079.1 hypothetical protein [Fibrella forsythiae]